MKQPIEIDKKEYNEEIKVSLLWRPEKNRDIWDFLKRNPQIILFENFMPIFVHI